MKNKALYLALGMKLNGIKEALGLWIEQTEGAKFWLRVLNELKNRGVQDVLIVAEDGLKGFPEAITGVFLKAQVQTCILHMVRHSLRFVPWKDRKQVAAYLTAIYRLENEDMADNRLSEFEGKWDKKVPHHRPVLAAQLGADHSLPGLSREKTQNHLHHQHHRKPEPEPAQGDENQGPLSK